MLRFAGLSRATMALCLLLGLSPVATAQDRGGSAVDEPVPVDQVAGSIQPTPSVQPMAPPDVRSVERRPAILVPLYASFVALQILDVHSTTYALAHGAVEGNPTIKGLAGNTVGMVAVKAAGTAGVILISEKLQKKNRAAAIGLMIATNSAMTWVVQHNYRAAR